MKKTVAPKKGDIIIIAALLLAALLWLALLAWRDRGGTQGLVAEIYQDGQLLHSITLEDGEQELRLECAAGYNVLQIGPQGVSIVEADCNNRDCVHMGLQSRAGGVIACLPHRLLICLSGEKEADFDAIAR